jgi:hypothetical protein
VRGYLESAAAYHRRRMPSKSDEFKPLFDQ